MGSDFLALVTHFYLYNNELPLGTFSYSCDNQHNFQIRDHEMSTADTWSLEHVLGVGS